MAAGEGEVAEDKQKVDETKAEDTSKETGDGLRPIYTLRFVGPIFLPR